MVLYHIICLTRGAASVISIFPFKSTFSFQMPR